MKIKNGSVSVAVINRNDHPAKINLNLGSLTVDKAFRKYLYDPENVPFNYFGDLQDPCCKIPLKKNGISDIIPPHSLAVYTTSYDDDPPAGVSNLKIERIREEGRNRALLTWDPNTENDLCYYRIYRSIKPTVEIIPQNEIGTTIANSFKDISVHNLPEYHYRVIAVDQSGNASN